MVFSRLHTPTRRGWLTVRRFLSLCVLLCLFSTVSGAHYIRFNADFLYARDFAGADAGTPNTMSLSEAQAWIGSGKAEALLNSNGFAPAIGFGYRYTYRALMIDFGLGAEFRYTTDGPNAIVDLMAPATDDTGLAFAGYYTWNNRMVNMQHVGLQLPLMIGGQWNRIYVMAGVKANIDIWNRSSEKGNYTLWGDYGDFMDPIRDVPEHGFVTNEPYETAPVNGAIGWTIRACAEVGVCLNPQSGKNSYSRKPQPKYYIGAYAEYGFIGNQESYRPLLAGIRLTILLPLSEKRVCRCLGD